MVEEPKKKTELERILELLELVLARPQPATQVHIHMASPLEQVAEGRMTVDLNGYTNPSAG